MKKEPPTKHVPLIVSTHLIGGEGSRFFAEKRRRGHVFTYEVNEDGTARLNHAIGPEDLKKLVGWLTSQPNAVETRKIKRMKARLREIAEIIESVDNRAMAADGPVTPTLQEMTQDEISRIYYLAKGRK